MGLDTNGVRLLLESKLSGADFSSTLTLGRQGLHLTSHELRGVFGRVAGRPLSDRDARRLLDGAPGSGGSYCETLLRDLGASSIESIDASGYEGATILHDLNTEVPAALHDRFSCIVDGGTLEHVFDVPTAILNCMRMLKAGGHFLSITPTNNFSGHGFYQFSPELFFSVFTARTGFRVEAVYAFEDAPFATWFQAADPRSLGKRVTLCNSRPTYLAVRIKKLASSALDRAAIAAAQSDYAGLWQRSGEQCGGSVRSVLRSVLDSLPAPVRPIADRAKKWIQRGAGFRAPFFRRYR